MGDAVPSLCMRQGSACISNEALAFVLDAQTQNGDEPVAIFLSSRGKVAFLARIFVETARYTFLRQLAVNDDK